MYPVTNLSWDKYRVLASWKKSPRHGLQAARCVRTAAMGQSALPVDPRKLSTLMRNGSILLSRPALLKAL